MAKESKSPVGRKTGLSKSVITSVSGVKNPARPTSTRYKIFAKFGKCDGQTVGAFYKAVRDDGNITRAAHAGHVRKAVDAGLITLAEAAK